MDSLLSSSPRSAEDRLIRVAARLASRSQRSLQSDAGDASLFVEYRPPARDTISVPPHVLYVAAGLVLVIVATYAIVGHLIDDLLRDLAGTGAAEPCSSSPNWLFGPKSEAADAERGREDEQERAGVLPGFNHTDQHQLQLQHHHITSL